MKKIASLIGLSLVFIVCLAAKWDFGAFKLDLSPMDPLYKESRAYPFANNVTFRYLIAPKDNEYLPTDILVSDASLNGGKGGYKRLSFKDPNVENNTYWNLKAAVNIGVLRLSYLDSYALEAYIHGGLNTVFGAYGGVDVLGFDGQYGAGAAFSLRDILVFRFGFHHFSGHWGDETIGDFYKKYADATSYSGITEYTRNNSWLFNLQYKPFEGFRLLAEVELPMGKGWIRPGAHVPASTIKDTSEESPDYGKPLSDYIYSQEGLDGKTNSSYPASYKGWRIGLGAELEYPIENVGYAYLAGDLELHQDGKIDLETLSYDDNRPWEMEYTIALGLALETSPNLPDFTIELSYHDGRFPLLNYFFQRSRYFSAGLAVTI